MNGKLFFFSEKVSLGAYVMYNGLEFVRYAYQILYEYNCFISGFCVHCTHLNILIQDQFNPELKKKVIIVSLCKTSFVRLH